MFDKTFRRKRKRMTDKKQSVTRDMQDMDKHFFAFGKTSQPSVPRPEQLLHKAMGYCAWDWEWR